MPFLRQPDGTYTSPSGKTFTEAQVKMYYATDGFTKKPVTRRDPPPSTK